MKNSIFYFATCIIIFLASCGPGKNEKRVKAYQDSINKLDSIAKAVPEVESWDIFQLFLKNEGGLKNKYLNKRIRVKNLVLDNVWADNIVMQCLAYSAKDSLLSNTSQKGNRADKIAEWQDIVNDSICKYNTDFTYYFELHFNEPVDTTALKQRIVVEKPYSRKNSFNSILTVEGDFKSINSNSFMFKKCAIKGNRTR